MAVTREREAVVDVALCLLVLDVSGIDLRFEEREASSDALLLFTEQVERDRSGVVGLEQLLPFAQQFVALPLVGLPFVAGGGVEAVELSDDEFP
ncbi:MAG: hypothetical protein ACOX61_02725 [Brooklawnia sp.]